jgi:NAD(P)-dependent dehydrogenase (short-subunit alcohol dehydrogenase family)
MQQRQRDLTGKVILVTGATSGIGLEAVRALARRNAHVIVAARDAGRGQIVVDALRFDAELLVFDVASFASIRAAAERFAATHPKLDVLVNNAGIAPVKRTLSVDGHESTWATNVLGPFLLTQALLPLLLAAEEPRVVNVGSGAHRLGKLVWDDLEFARRRYVGFQAYAQSKLALMLLTRAQAAREKRLAVNCVHPGAIATGIWRELPAPLRFLLARFLPPPDVGAAPVVRLAGAPDTAHTSGLYFERFKAIDPSPEAMNDADGDRLWNIVAAETAA